MACFDALAIPYFVGGSMAIPLYGLWRQTNDADLVADIAPDQIEPLARDLEKDFYADEEMMRSALLRGGRSMSFTFQRLSNSISSRRRPELFSNRKCAGGRA
jgi:hypothetical protein